MNRFRDLYVASADGTGEAELVYVGPRPIADHAWSPREEWLVYADDSPELDDGIRIGFTGGLFGKLGIKPV